MIEGVIIVHQEIEMGLEEEVQGAVRAEMMILATMTSRQSHFKICKSFEQELLRVLFFVCFQNTVPL
jgi:hypothetical protein